jgi:hypothetical protein
VEPLHHPAAWPLVRIEHPRGGALFTAWPDMGDVAALLSGEPRQIVIVAGIQPQMLRLLCSRHWSWSDERIQRRRSELDVVDVCPCYDDRQRQSVPVTQRAALGPVLAAIRRIVADAFRLRGRGAPERGFGHDPIQALPLPVDAH